MGRGDYDPIFEALWAGASSYLFKRAAPDALIEAIWQVRAGGSPIARRVVSFFQQHERSSVEDGISTRGREILSQLTQGKVTSRSPGSWRSAWTRCEVTSEEFITNCTCIPGQKPWLSYSVRDTCDNWGDQPRL